MGQCYSFTTSSARQLTCCKAGVRCVDEWIGGRGSALRWNQSDCIGIRRGAPGRGELLWSSLNAKRLQLEVERCSVAWLNNYTCQSRLSCILPLQDSPDHPVACYFSRAACFPKYSSPASLRICSMIGICTITAGQSRDIFANSPLYSPRRPSCRTMVAAQCTGPRV